jgi:hypothetical protein
MVLFPALSAAVAAATAAYLAAAAAAVTELALVLHCHQLPRQHMSLQLLQSAALAAVQAVVTKH